MALEVSFKKIRTKQLNNMNKVEDPSQLEAFVWRNRSCCYFGESQIKELNIILDLSADSLEANGVLFENLFDIMCPNDLIPKQFEVTGYHELEQRLQELAVKVRSSRKT